MNRRRVATVSAVALFAVAVVGGALIASRRDDGPKKTRSAAALAKLPVAGATAGASAMAQPISEPQYVVKGTLPVLPSTATAFAVTGTTTKADAAGLAHAIGMQGDAVATGGAWLVADGTRRLAVPAQASDGWLFSDQPGNAQCPATADCAVSSSGTVTTVAPCPPPACPPGRFCAATSCTGGSPPARPAGTPTKEAADQVGRAFLGKLGVDVAHDRIETRDLFDGWDVVADPVVNGLPVLGFSASVTVGANSVVTSASGHLDRFEKVGDYPLAGTDAGLTRSKAGTYGSFGGPRPMMGATAAAGPASGVATSVVEGAASGTATASGASPADQGSAPATPGSTEPQPCPATAGETCLPPTTIAGSGVEPPSPVPPMPPPDPITITGVHLSLEFVPSFASGKPAMLVPAYVFETAGADLPPVPAVVDSLLEQPAVPPPGDCAQPDGGPGRFPPGQAPPDGCAGKPMPEPAPATPASQPSPARPASPASPAP